MKDMDAGYRSILSSMGQPVHGRSLEIEIFDHGPERVKVKGVIVDLRKQGFVPTGGDLQASGVIHHMLLDAVVRRSDLMLESLEPLQPVVAFEPSEATGGESCRDIAWRIPELAGRPLDQGFSKWLQAGFGGALGCSHLLTLAHLLASTTMHALSLDADRFPGEDGHREEGERVFKRSLVLDGFELADPARLRVTAVLNDIHLRPKAAVRDFLDRLATQREIRFLADVGLPSMGFDVLEAEQRKRESPDALPWEDLTPVLLPLRGVGAMKGLSHRVLELFSDQSDMHALQDILLSVGPALIQCLGSMAGRMAEKQSGDAVAPISALGGMNNSCYLWRVGGPSLQHRDEEMKSFDAES